MLRLFTAMMHQTFSQEPFLVSGLHGDQILGARSNQQDSFSILAGEDELTERSFAACFARRSGCPEGLNPFLVENFLAIDVRKLLQPAPGPGDKRR